MKSLMRLGLVINFFLLFGVSNLYAAEDSANQRVLVVRVLGDVTVSGKPIEIGDSIKIGAKVIATGKRSYIQFQFASGSLIMLRDGELVISKIKTKSTVMDLIKGTVFSYIKKKDGNKVKIRTANAAIGVRGTKFITMATPEETYLCVCDGVVNIKNKKGSLDVVAKEDVHVSLQSDLSKASANDQMWAMAKEGFDAMGVEITNLK